MTNKKVSFSITFCFFLLFLSGTISSQNNYRELKLTEILRIIDNGEDYYFRFPWDATLTSQGEIFLADENQLIRFDATGKFIKNYYKSGAGPCELYTMRGYTLFENSIIVLNVRPHKIIWFDNTGNCNREFRIYENFFSAQLLTYRNDKYYLITYGMPGIKGNSGFTESPYRIMEMSNDGKELKELASFPVKTFVVMVQGGRFNNPFCRFISRLGQGRFVVISHTSEYLVKVFDLEKKVITTSFSRKYERVKRKKITPSDFTVGNQQYEELKQEYEADIQNLFIVKNEIWVITSTENSHGTLIDVFDFHGKYMDSYYIKLKGTIMATSDNTLLVREKGKEENLELVKYRIER